MKILIVEDEQETGDYLKQGLFEAVFAAVQTPAACQRRFASTVRIPQFLCPAQHRNSRDQARTQQ